MQYNVGQFVIVAAVFTAVFSLTAVEEEARYIDWLQLLLLVKNCCLAHENPVRANKSSLCCVPAS